MMLQTLFVLTLCGAFYMLVSFSTSTQQILAAHDEGQIVISYIESRIRNAGLGLWGCRTPENIRKAFKNVSAITGDKLALPVAITTNKKPEESTKTGKIYKGNYLTLLYAHKDGGQYTLFTENTTTVSISNNINSSGNNFTLLGGKSAYTGSRFGGGGNNQDISNYAAIESSGYPVYLMPESVTGQHVRILSTTSDNVDIHPMSELLNIECERIYVSDSSGGRSFMVSNLGLNSSGKADWNAQKPHTKGILEIYMELDTTPDIPIFSIKVLVSEGIRSDTNKTPRPEDWPDEYWKPHKSEFEVHKVHVSRASWKLYNLEPFTY